jgi:hypothetical protein
LVSICRLLSTYLGSTNALADLAPIESGRTSVADYTGGTSLKFGRMMPLAFLLFTTVGTQFAHTIASAAQAHGQDDDITVLTLTLAPAEVLHG